MEAVNSSGWLQERTIPVGSEFLISSMRARRGFWYEITCLRCRSPCQGNPRSIAIGRSCCSRPRSVWQSASYTHRYGWTYAQRSPYSQSCQDPSIRTPPALSTRIQPIDDSSSCRNTLQLLDKLEVSCGQRESSVWDGRARTDHRRGPCAMNITMVSFRLSSYCATFARHMRDRYKQYIVQRGPPPYRLLRCSFRTKSSFARNRHVGSRRGSRRDVSPSPRLYRPTCS